ncbi:uncharacterized protein B0H18DRAFT_977599 [Fomitopsis serialis]|uniref:uncharacterized protein n=1 Tax=Fomitopsis serialis TaxID=139415 RepID=UPI0020078ED8|nr:uncharacterized protein B0H18DRAFT_977599 [Neoantrodia serialis]KAH9934658.1 hypothetical protein B0H18DRAFT_977599 [Neoantrodia serialis]
MRPQTVRVASRVLATYLSLQFQTVQAASTNATIDDNNGDSVTGRKPKFSASWNYGPDCPGCLVQPDQQHTFDRSWHDTTASPGDTSPHNVTLHFTGTAISYATTYVNASFRLDGHHVGSYEYDPSKSSSVAYRYNVTVYQNASLDYAEHDLVIEVKRDVNASYFAFDWAEYTYDPDRATTTTSSGTRSTAIASASASTTSVVGSSASSHSTVGPIVGGVVGGVGAVVLALLFFLLPDYPVSGEDARREEIEPMSKPESDVEEAGVTEMRPPGSTLARPFPPSLTSCMVAALPVGSDASSTRDDLTTVSAFGGASNTADSSLTAPSSGRRSKSVMQLAELSRQMRDMEEQVEQLRRRQSSRGPSQAQSPLRLTHEAPNQQTRQQEDSELRRQIATLQLEVERLRAVAEMDEPPPAYEASENRP